MSSRSFLLCSILLSVVRVPMALAAPEIPGKPQETPVAVVGATVHPVSGPAIEGATLVFDKGRITAIGRSLKVPPRARRIDARGRHVYPGLIDAYSSLGLVEIASVRATQDSSETGLINPNVKAQLAVNPDSELIPVTRAGGVLIALSVPSGGLISGTSALLELDGWTYEDMTLRAPAGMHVRWPRVGAAAAPLGGESEESASRREDGVALLERVFADARAYQKARAAGEVDGVGRQARDVRWEAMLPVLDGRLPLIASADEIQQIQSAVAFAVRQQVKLIILGGYDAPDCAAMLKQYRVPVIVSGIYREPMRRSDDYDAAYTVPARLHAAGVKFCIAGGGSDYNARNLPFHAGMAAGFGLPADEALKAVTLYPAEILGVSGRVGSLEPGKDATLIVTDGDPLEASTQVLSAFLQGRTVDLSNRQKRLWQKYEEKYRHQQ